MKLIHTLIHTLICGHVFAAEKKPLQVLQGWNDLVDGSTYPQRDKPGGYDAYATAMAHFTKTLNHFR